MSWSTSSSIGRRSPRRAKPSMSSGVYVLPPPMTAIFTPIWPRSDGYLTPLLITLSAIAAESTQPRSPRQGGPVRTLARFRLELGPIPLHHQVYLDLKAALDAGEWGAGDRLPTERDMAERYGCSLITIRRALSELVREGRLERTRGRGTFVLPPRIDVDFSGSLSFSEELRLQGLEPETRLVASRPEAAGENVAQALGLEVGAPTLYLERLRLADGE